MKLNFTICSVLLLSSWWQQPLGKTYGLQYQNGLIVSDLFAFRKTKTCRQHALLVLRLTLTTKVPLSLSGEGQVVNDKK